MNNYEKLIKKFEEIAKKGWIKGVNKNTNSVGLTFENLLSKKIDSNFFPDYNGIEIKCSQRYSYFPIKLFSLSFDGPSFFEMNELIQKYGKEDYMFKSKKIINITLFPNKKILFNKKYSFELKLSDNENRLYVKVYKWHGYVLDRSSYINYSTIKNHVEIKLTNMAIIWASKKNINDYPHFRYYKMCIYKLKSFEIFLDLIRKNIIIVSIEGNITRKGEEIGRLRNQNIIFRIPKDKIEELFDIKVIYNIDRNYCITK